ncbi:hypothetical protein D3C72_2484080 [compost metagenome]
MASFTAVCRSWWKVAMTFSTFSSRWLSVSSSSSRWACRPVSSNTWRTRLTSLPWRNWCIDRFTETRMSARP